MPLRLSAGALYFTSATFVAAPPHAFRSFVPGFAFFDTRTMASTDRAMVSSHAPASTAPNRASANIGVNPSVETAAIASGSKSNSLLTTTNGVGVLCTCASRSGFTPYIAKCSSEQPWNAPAPAPAPFRAVPRSFLTRCLISHSGAMANKARVMSAGALVTIALIRSKQSTLGRVLSLLFGFSAAALPFPFAGALPLSFPF
mmetsp:Transcript_13997/g.46354  ORF Transcript_13997/g.46354 Transcript_13997/m.46354 type:complete len:201 (-) Transcript_13997:595-1197(-)